MTPKATPIKRLDHVTEEFIHNCSDIDAHKGCRGTWDVIGAYWVAFKTEHPIDGVGGLQAFMGGVSYCPFCGLKLEV